jgi:hypothetical protein
VLRCLGVRGCRSWWGFLGVGAVGVCVGWVVAEAAQVPAVAQALATARVGGARAAWRRRQQQQQRMQ